MNKKNNKTPAPIRRSRERGVVLIFCLIVLVILLSGGVAVIRSTNSSLFSAGNLAFKRDLLNQGEQAVAHVLALFQGTGGLASSSSTQSDNISLNYRASQLATNSQGIPTAMLGDDEAFGAVGVITNDLTSENSNVTSGVGIRYLIDRMCSAAGVPSSNNCVQAQSAPTGGTAGTGGPAVTTASVYRVTIRVTGPRDTQVFMQTSFTKPD
jgi:type IV pilus assembly protein PilX